MTLSSGTAVVVEGLARGFEDGWCANIEYYVLFA